MLNLMCNGSDLELEGGLLTLEMDSKWQEFRTINGDVAQERGEHTDYPEK